MTSLALVSTYPPTACGLATFAAALATGLDSIGVRDIGVVRSIVDGEPTDNAHVVAHLRPNSPASRAVVVSRLNQYDCALVQHEYGIYGGPDGSEVLDVLQAVERPSITTLHTVPLKPTPNQRHVLEEVVHLSSAAVTMTASARNRLIDLYDVDRDKVTTIAHGATVPHTLAPPSSRVPTFLTWGLLGPGKGIEWVIDAMAILNRLGVNAHYVIAGRTHPKVLEHSGEAYRNMLASRALSQGVGSMVSFDSTYRSLPSLLDLIGRATCVVLPYDSDDQITSGVLVDAVAAGRPVIATRFPHAEELLAHGAGVVVSHRDVDALAGAMHKVATQPDHALALSRAAAKLAPAHSWSHIAQQYLSLAMNLTAPQRVMS
jgi:glycosyltransferase involved in cell wall biosynthesis